MSIEFLLTSLILVVAPGTGVLYTLAYGLSRGAKGSIYAAIGCNGRGIAVATALGPHLAGLLAGDDAPLPVDICDIETVRGHFLIQHGPRIYMPWARFKDLRDKKKD